MYNPFQLSSSSIRHSRMAEREGGGGELEISSGNIQKSNVRTVCGTWVGSFDTGVEELECIT